MHSYVQQLCNEPIVMSQGELIPLASQLQKSSPLLPPFWSTSSKLVKVQTTFLVVYRSVWCFIVIFSGNNLQQWDTMLRCPYTSLVSWSIFVFMCVFVLHYWSLLQRHGISHLLSSWAFPMVASSPSLTCSSVLAYFWVNSVFHCMNK